EAALLKPTSIAIAADRLIVIDAAERQVVALDPHTGRVSWRFGRNGSGPGEFKRPVRARGLPTGEVAILDPGNQRITVLGADGALVRTVPLVTTSGPPESLCVLP